MPLIKEQVKELKKQLSEQIQDLPEEQKKAAQQQIDEMSDEAIESMLKQQQSKQTQQPIFRSIVDGKIPSRKIDENREAIAVLDTKPISRGHTIIIPKNALTNTKDIPQQAFSLAKKISKKICVKLKASSTEIQTQFSFGEIIINIIPIYDKSLSINSPRQESKEEELQEVYQKLRVIKKPKTIKIRKKHQKEMIYMKRKVP